MAKSVAVMDQTNTGIQQLKNGPARLTSFLHDVRVEMRKVVTPSRAEVQTTTIVVIATVFVFALYFGIVDYIVQHAMDFLFSHTVK